MNGVVMTEGGHGTAEAIVDDSCGQVLPVVVLHPGAPSVFESIGEIVRSWELLRMLAWREVRLRYSQTTLGVVWVILQPLVPMILFTAIFGRIPAFASARMPYQVFVYSGLMLWSFFSNAAANSSRSLVESPDLVTKVYFPRILIPASAVLAALVDLAVQLVAFLFLTQYYQVSVTLALLSFPVFALHTGILAFGLGLFFSALNVKYRDVRYALPFVFQLWMIASPIMYPTTVLPAPLRWLWMLNPLAASMDAYRAVLSAQPVDWPGFGVSSAIAVVLLLGGLFAFTRMEEYFADLI